GRAVIAVGVVPAPALQHVGYPGAAAPARIPVIARAAKAAAAIAVAADGTLRQVAQRLVDRNRAGLASGIVRFRQRRTAFDGPVSLQPQRGLTGGASFPVRDLAAERAPVRFVSSKISDTVTRQYPKSDVATAVIEFCKIVDDIDDLMRLQQHRAVVDGIPHRHRQLYLPVFRASRGDLIEDQRQL